jgi:hypothetical protein
VNATKKKKKTVFFIQITDTQNASWQGTITWADGRKAENFRSALEMIKLIDSAVSENENPEESPPG